MMSKYTMEVRYICEQLANATIETQVGDVPEIIEKAAPQIFDFDFPIWNEDYRKTLEEKILLHFYMREIGQETVGEWKLRLMQTLQDIMPEMNELYKSVEFKYDPLTDIDYTTDTKGENKSTSGRKSTITDEGSRTEHENATDSANSTEASDSSGKQLFNDTPMGQVDSTKDADGKPNNDPWAGDVWKGKYATSATMNKNDSTSNSESKNTHNADNNATINNTRTGDETQNDTANRSMISRVFGKSSFRSYGRLIQEFRENIMNVDKLVFEKLECCFMLLY